MKLLPAAGVAVSCTVVPLPKLALHEPLTPTPVVTQLMPDGADAIVPAPAPAGVTVSS